MFGERCYLLSLFVYLYCIYLLNFSAVTGGPDTKQETIRPGLWQCSICTYDNDESMAFCDICGVVRRPLPNIGTSDSSKIGNSVNEEYFSLLLGILICILFDKGIPFTWSKI